MPVPADPSGGPRRPHRPHWPPRPAPRQPEQAKAAVFPWTAVAVVAFLACLAMYAWGWLVGGSAVGVALFVIPLLLVATAPILVRASRTETRFDLGGLLALGLIARFAATYYRFTHAADGATFYHAGAELAQSFRHLAFGVDAGGPVPGTGGMKYIAGIAEVFTNSNAFATFLLFAWVGFLGCYLFYRAFVTALPDADHRRYAVLIMLWPTLVYWPSSISKDGWMIFTLGIAALGGARVLVRRPGGYALLLVGLVVGGFVRPHVSLLFAVAFGIGLLVGRRADRPGALTPTVVAKVAGLVVLLALGGYLVTRTGDLLNTADISGSSIDAALSTNASRTGQGGSAFAPADPTNPLGYAEAAVTIMVRPVLTEAHGTEALVTSVEAMFLAALCVLSWRRLLTIPRRLRSQPYVAVACAYLLMFFFAFGSIANFGILARERSQMMPFVFVLLALPAATARSGPAPRPTSRVEPRSGRPPSVP